ncbi:pH-response regulator 5 [Hyphodiscus hymeniophilus]|uniref:PH-response regulator 5 n=1 Tax=Hyphodiscus hymeniophilus TaxID=353542 RepID=A0A9P6VMX8_9HELO|nr:pH-response regulator 5 [Hyphodiscus hymeniophilus]
MMLRPATPLTILLFAAFVLLLISVLSTPVIKQIPLATFDGVDFGVFGFCKTGSTCSSFGIGYNFGSVYNSNQESSFDLPTTTRNSLSSILIVHPIAAFFTLVMTILAASAHFHSPSHSPRYLLGIFILSILTLILALLSFLIDVLLFVPHMAWGSYLVLAATILIAASGIVSCAMRRTLVGRKARKRRIAENAEMNGENFYNRQGGDPLMPTTSNTFASGPEADKMPAFATFEVAKKGEERTSDERIPLTTRTPSERSPSNIPAVPGGSDRYGGPPPRMGGVPARDQYGNPIAPPPGAYTGSRSRDPSTDPSLNRQYSDNSVNPRGRGGTPPGGYRGRGYPMNGRGNYGPPPRGYFNGSRGGNGPRGGYGPQRGGYGGPPGPNGGPSGGMNDGVMAAGAIGAAGAGAMMRGGGGSRGRGAPPGYGPTRSYDRGESPAYDGSGRRPAPPGAYGRDMSPAPPSTNQYAAYRPDDTRSSLPRAESPPPLPGLGHEPIGQAIEMDATTGSPSTAPKGFGQFGQLRDSDADVAGMVGLQQQGLSRPNDTSQNNSYSSDEPYVPPRQVWGEAGRSSPLNPAAAQPAELHSSPGRARVTSGDNYFEDVDPRFAEPPSALVPGPIATGYPAQGPSNNNLRVGGLDGNNSYEDIQEGARSPAESDRSNFTSVSQRGVNPRWNGGPGGYGGPPMPMPNRRSVNAPQRNDVLLNSNPDFQLAGSRGGRGGSSGRGGRAQPPPMGASMVPGSSYPGAGAL